MRRLYTLGFVAALAAAAVWGAVDIHARANGLGRHRCQPVCVQYVIVPQTVYVEVPGKDGGGGRQRGKNPNNPADVQVHCLYILNTEDKDIGGKIAVNGNKVRELCDSILRRDFRGLNEVVSGAGLDKKAVLDRLAFMSKQMRPQDTLFVYCLTHGAADPDGGQSIMMFKAPPGADAADPKELRLARADLEAAIQAAPCRLRLLVSDCCYQSKRQAFDLGDVAPGPDPSDVPAPAAEFKTRPEAPRAAQTLVVEDLFVNHTGFYSFTSAAPKQFAVTSVFTPSFVDLVKGWPTEFGADARWDRLVTLLGKDVSDRYAYWLPRLDENTKEILGKNKDVETEKGKGQTTQTVYPTPGVSPPRYERPTPPADAAAADEGKAKSELLSAAPPADPARGTLSIAFTPGSKVTVDGEPVPAGVTSPVLYQVAVSGAARSVAVRAEPKDGAAVVRQVTVVRGQTHEVAVTAAAAPPPAEARPAEVLVRVPDGADLYINDALHPHRLAERVLETPPLAADRVYTLSLRVKSVRDGKEVVGERRVELRSGQRAEVDFTRDAAATAARP